MNLPLEFISNIEGVFGNAGKQFLANLPALIDEASQRWSLTNVEPSSTLSYNFVAFANRADEQVVLKLGVPNSEMRSEMAALRLFNGEGACRLIDYDEDNCWMLLERLRPGVMLSTLENDEEATQIAVDVMQKIWRPIEPVILSEATLPGTVRQGRCAPHVIALRRHHAGEGLYNGERDSSVAEGRSLRMTYDKFIQLSDWFNGLQKLRAMFHGGTGPLNEKLVERVEHSVRDFFTENHKPVLMHGDFHHFNILSSGRGWLIIDPKGVIGPACYEVGPFLINPWGDLLSGHNYRQITQRRIDILHEHLGFERERVREWALAHAVVSAWWSIEDQGDWHYAADFAEMIAELRLRS